MKFRSCLVALCLSALIPTFSVAADDAGTASTFQLMDVFQLEYATEPRISPAGKRVLYLRNSMDIMKDRRRATLWIVNADGSDHRPLVATGSAGVSQPRWSPDGDRIVYVSSAAETGPAQIFCRWMDTGQTARLTQLPQGPGNLTWSPDGKSLAFTMLVESKPKPFVTLPAPPKGAKWAAPARVISKVLYRSDGSGYVKDGFRHVFVLPAEGGTPKQLTTGDFHHKGRLAWTSDGKAILFSANRTANWEYEPRESELHKVTVANRAITQLTRRKGPDHSPAVSRDGKTIAWLGFDDRKASYQNTKLYLMNADGSGRRELTSKLDRSVAAPIWSKDGKGLFFQYDDLGSTKLGFVQRDGSVSTLASHIGGTTIGRPYASGSFTANSRDEFAFTHSTPDHPADVAVGKLGVEKLQRATRLNTDLFSQRTMATTEEITFKSSHDGRRMQAWIVKPPSFDAKKKYPLILEIHGGPFANYGDRFAVEMQIYAAAGYVVLYVNPRGSTSYGEEFANLIHHAYPGHDYDDLMSGVDAVIKQGYVDADNCFVTGGSGGGVLTAWVVGKTNRFRAAVAAKPVINWYSFVLTSDGYPFFNKYWFPGYPWDNAEHYLKRSPISLVGNVKTPTMLLTGESDHRTPMSESEQFYQALKLQKVDSVLVRIPDASHAIVKRPSRLIVKTQHILKWFEMYRQTK